MKFGAIPENIAESLALRMGKVPIPLLDVLFGPMKARVVMAAVRLGIMDTIAAAPASTAELAALLKLDEDCLDIVLRVLVHCDYLEFDGLRYSLSSMSKQMLSPGAPMDRRGYVEWNYSQWEMLGNLEELLRSGRGLDLHQTLRDPVAWGHYQRGMLEGARDHASFVGGKVPVPAGARSLIDLGGSHGLLGASICREHPPMRSTVLDLEQAIGPARELAHAEGITDVVTHKAADLLRDDFGTGHDVALLGNILHHFSPEQNVELLKKVRRALQAKGTVAIWEFERPMRDSKAGTGDAVALLFRLTSSASAYHGDEYSAWLKEAGFNDVKVTRPVLLPGYILVSGACRQ